jgi:hypothetical protein
MKVAIMQPYFFPYIGYFQLINAVDIFVIYDDVNFIKQGWISKNKILVNKYVTDLTLQLNGASSFKKINEIGIGNNRIKLLKTIEQSYKKAPYFSNVFPLINDILEYNEINLAIFLSNSIRKISEYLNINTCIVISSNIEKNNQLKGKDRVIEICKKTNASVYINAIGGMDLYEKDEFLQKKIILHFIKTNIVEYNQFIDNFIPGLSIIDIMMFNSPDEIKKMLNQYELI